MKRLPLSHRSAVSYPWKRRRAEYALKQLEDVKVQHAEISFIGLAEGVVAKILHEELRLAVEEWVRGPQEFEVGARERIKSAIERSYAALRYVHALKGQAGQAARDLSLEVVQQNAERP